MYWRSVRARLHHSYTTATKPSWGKKSLPKNVNPAYRVWQLLRRAVAQSQQIRTLDAWARVFGVDSIEPPTSHFETLSLLGLLAEEARTAERQMKESAALSDELYEFAFRATEQAVDVTQLGSRWQTYKQRITPDVLRALQTCSELTRGEEGLIEEADLAILVEELASFEEAVIGGVLADELKTFILQQIHIMRRAVLEYRVIGVRAFRAASVEVTTNAAEQGSLIDEHVEEEEVKTLAVYWKRLVYMASAVNIFRGAIEASGKMLELGGDVIDKM